MRSNEPAEDASSSVAKGTDKSLPGTELGTRTCRARGGDEICFHDILCDMSTPSASSES